MLRHPRRRRYLTAIERSRRLWEPASTTLAACASARRAWRALMATTLVFQGGTPLLGRLPGALAERALPRSAPPAHRRSRWCWRTLPAAPDVVTHPLAALAAVRRGPLGRRDVSTRVHVARSPATRHPTIWFSTIRASFSCWAPVAHRSLQGRPAGGCASGCGRSITLKASITGVPRSSSATVYVGGLGRAGSKARASPPDMVTVTGPKFNDGGRSRGRDHRHRETLRGSRCPTRCCSPRWERASSAGTKRPRDRGSFPILAGAAHRHP